MKTADAAALPIRVVTGRERFYVHMAAICLAVAILGFAPSYWVPMFRGSLDVAPIAHLHAFLFYGWMVLFLWQTSLVAAGRLGRHREFGVAGVALASAMVVVGLGMTINTLKRFEAAGLGESARAFSTVSVTGILLFAVLVAIAVAKRRKPDVHKRLMLVASISILQAGVGRWFMYFLAPPQEAGALGLSAGPPVAFTVLPGLVTNLLIVAAMIYDRRRIGRVHPVYWMAGGTVLAVQVLRIPLSSTRAWDQLALWLAALSP